MHLGRSILLLAGTCLLAAPVALAATARPAAIALSDRIGWGGGAPVPDQARWLDEQLHPSADDGLPAAVQARIDAMPISQMSLTQIAADVVGSRQALLQERRADGRGRGKAAAAPASANDAMAMDMAANAGQANVAQADAADAKQKASPAQRAYRQKLTDYARQAAERSLLRDIYSKNQLKEQLTWFWFNHFNVSQRKGVIAATVGDYEETAIRPHVLGKFRDLLTATAFHPAMLQYLDNQQNAVGHINENFAREIMELHTMGVGSGYTQKDVQELARILTGVGLNFAIEARPRIRDALMRSSGDDMIAFNPRRHDFGDKQFLGHVIKGTGLDETRQALLILSREPATAHHISLQLAQYFCCDAPPDRLVNAMAATFLQSDGDIAQVLTTLFHAPEFTASLGAKFKDPMHYAISTMRTAYGDTPITNLQPLTNWLTRMGEPLYGHETPDGYAITQDAWAGPGAMETRFEIARLAGGGKPSLLQDGPGAPPPDLRDAAYVQTLLPAMGAATQTALAQASAPADWNLLFLSSPEFMNR